MSNFQKRTTVEKSFLKRCQFEMKIKTIFWEERGVVFLSDTLFVGMSVRDAFEYPRLGSLV